MQIDPQSAASRTQWSLPRGTAQTFYARSAGVLGVSAGRAWATVGATAQSPQARWSPRDEPGDFFVGPGRALCLRAGQTVVLESWPAEAERFTQLSWQADAPSPVSARWQCNVAQPTRELAQGLGQTASALWRLLRGLAGYSDFLVAGRGKVQHPLECNAP